MKPLLDTRIGKELLNFGVVIFRIQQLEGILLERNMNLRQLLSENFLMSARLKRLQSEFGVDAVKEALKGLS